MPKSRRDRILAGNKRLREGLNSARAMDWGYAEMRIPEEDWKVLRKRYPDLEAKDAATREAAWREFSAGPLGDLYRVVRSPREVQRSVRLGNKGVIVK